MSQSTGPTRKPRLASDRGNSIQYGSASLPTAAMPSTSRLPSHQPQAKRDPVILGRGNLWLTKIAIGGWETHRPKGRIGGALMSGMLQPRSSNAQYIQRSTVKIDPLKNNDCPFQDRASFIRHMKSHFRELDVEAMDGFFFSRRGEFICRQRISVGSTNEVFFYPREIARLCIGLGAKNTIVCHNHTNGSPWPSRGDGDSTRKLEIALNYLGICLVDHFVVADELCSSMRYEGCLRLKLAPYCLREAGLKYDGNDLGRCLDMIALIEDPSADPETLRFV